MPSLNPTDQRAASARYYAKNREAVLQRQRDREMSEGRETMALTRVMVSVRNRAQRRVDAKRRVARMKLERPEKFRENRRVREARRSVGALARKRVWRRGWLKLYRSDPAVRLAKALRDRLYSALAGGAKTGSAVDLLGCSIPDAIKHIERQFRSGMTWSNRGDVWHVDHIRPLAGFDLSDPAQVAQACHFTNLRPLSKAANLAKGARQEFLL